MENRDKNRISWEVDRDKERKSVLRSYQERILDAKIALKEAARQGVRPSEDPKAIKIYTRLRQIETAFKNMLEVAYPEGDQVLIKLRANSSHLTPATCHGKYTEKDGGKVTVWLFNHVGVEKQKRKIHYGHIYRVRKDDKGT